MDTGRTLRQARRRAGLSQRALAERTGIAQPTVARVETGNHSPRVATLELLLGACGEALEALPRAGDGVDRTTIRALLALTRRNDWRRSRPRPRPSIDSHTPVASERDGDMTYDPLRALRTLMDRGVHFVVIGGVAGRLWGSPTLTNDTDVCCAADPENLQRLADALRELGAQAAGRR